jgi:histidyl-tRNA synthetase
LGVSDTDQAKAMVTIDKLDKVGISGVEEEMKERFGDKVSKATADWLNSLSGDLPVPAELKELFSSVDSLHPGALRFDPTLVRGMGYYTGAIFEIEHPASGASIGGGGRYDGMVGKWLGTATPAVGISIGFERVAELVASSGSGEKLLVLIFDADDFGSALLVQAEAIAAGYSVRLEPKPKKLNLLLETLKTQGFEHFAVLDEPDSGLKGLNIKPIS